MCVPDSMFQHQMTKSLRVSRKRYLEAQEEALSGKRVNKPSDDPVAMARARVYRDQGRRAETHGRAISAATSRLQVMDGAISEVESTMSRARQLAVQGANGSLGAADRAAIGAEVEELQNHLRALSETRHGGQYIFSGAAHDTAPLDATGTFQGSTVIPEVEVAPGVRVPLGVTAADVFTNTNGNAEQALSDLATALTSNDVSGIQAALQGVVDAGNAVTDARAQVGSYQMSVDIAEAVVDRNAELAEENEMREIGADVFETFSSLAQAQAALTAAVEIAAQLPPPGLVGG